MSRQSDSGSSPASTPDHRVGGYHEFAPPPDLPTRSRHCARARRLRASDQARRPSWAALAAHHGYADQSHLIREVQHLAGVSPARLHQERGAE